ncbi:NUDIX domain-containing protein [uncultured Pseudokineococcus sp.]|uniref:NUDIX domain-containing protein n=1 Tax=uncultured Pseudokineococcus sp. TaxID=1642928 RepID=UPI002614D26E|nr:NUDIX hydrolase [uncultured Pseudokineococcus sp.]
MGDGDGWVRTASGVRRWGLHGAAGLLLVADGDGGAPAAAGPHVLLQLRAGWTHLGGTWGLPGGAVDSHEDAVAGALREAHEETGVPPGAVDVVGQRVTADLGGWRYTVVLGRLRAGSGASPSAATAESDEVRWVALDEVARLPLHPGLAPTWEDLRLWTGDAGRPGTGRSG